MASFLPTSRPDPAPALPSATPTPDPEEEARKSRLEITARNRRGRTGLLATSARGIDQADAPRGKTLLGE